MGDGTSRGRYLVGEERLRQGWMAADREVERLESEIAQLRARAEQAEEQLRLSIIDAANNEAEANDLRAERDRLREALASIEYISDEMPRHKSKWQANAKLILQFARAALRGEEG